MEFSRKPKNYFSQKNTGPYPGNAGHTRNAWWNKDNLKRKGNPMPKEQNFLGRCRKLLHNMLELEDSKQFRTAPDKLKYPDYMSKVRYPMDLNKVQQKLQAGHYSNHVEFAADIQLMLDNWTGFIKDQSLPIYAQVSQLSLFFKYELAKITDAYNSYKAKRQRVVSTSQANSDEPLQVTVHQVQTRPTSDGNQSSESASDDSREVRFGQKPSNHRGRMGESDVRLPSTNGAGSVVQHPLGQGLNHAAKRTNFQGVQTSLQRQKSQEPRSASSAASRPQPSGQPSQNGTNYALPERQQLPLSSHGRMWTGVHGTMPSVSRPANSSTTSSSRHNSSSSTIMAGSPSPTDTSAPSVIPATSTSNYRRQLSVKVTKPASKQGPQTQVPSSPARLSLHLKSSNIWFGGFHMRLERTVTLSEKGFMFTLNGEVADEQFEVSAKEIVRCLGHLGKLKNTLFVFITPACVQRLKATVEKLRPGHQGTVCSLFVIFLQEMAEDFLGQLIYIFWMMSRTSVFGQIFSEVDRNGALDLLANIKPSILTRLQNVESKQSSVTNRMEQSPDGSSPVGNRTQSAEKHGNGRTKSTAASFVHDRSSSNSDKSQTNPHGQRERCLTTTERNLTSVPQTSTSQSGTVSVQQVSPSSASNSLPTATSTRPAPLLPLPPHLVLAAAPSTSCTSPQVSTSNFLQDTTLNFQSQGSNLFSTIAAPSAGTQLGGESCEVDGGQGERQMLEGTYFSSILQNIPGLQNPVGCGQPMPYSTTMFPLPSLRPDQPCTPLQFGSISFGNYSQQQAPVAESPSQEATTLLESSAELEIPAITVESVDEEPQHINDLDLEIIIPSDSDDDLTYIPNKPDDQPADGESDDLVMVRSRISTRCPITQQVMKEPVKNKHCGHFYDREGVQQLIINRADKAKCPVPGCGNSKALLMNDMDFDQDLLNFITSRNADKKDES